MEKELEDLSFSRDRETNEKEKEKEKTEGGEKKVQIAGTGDWRFQSFKRAWIGLSLSPPCVSLCYLAAGDGDGGPR